jgi:hypothetical protein
MGGSGYAVTSPRLAPYSPGNALSFARQASGSPWSRVLRLRARDRALPEGERKARGGRRRVSRSGFPRPPEPASGAHQHEASLWTNSPRWPRLSRSRTRRPARRAPFRCAPVGPGEVARLWDEDARGCYSCCVTADTFCPGCGVVLPPSSWPLPEGFHALRERLARSPLWSGREASGLGGSPSSRGSVN